MFKFYIEAVGVEDMVITLTAYNIEKELELTFCILRDINNEDCYTLGNFDSLKDWWTSYNYYQNPVLNFKDTAKTLDDILIAKKLAPKINPLVKLDDVVTILLEWFASLGYPNSIPLSLPAAQSLNFQTLSEQIPDWDRIKLRRPVD